MYRLVYYKDGEMKVKEDLDFLLLRKVVKGLLKKDKHLIWYLYNCGGTMLESHKD